MQLPALLPLATLAPSGHRPCSLRRLALLHAAVVLFLVVSGAAPYGCRCCSHGVWAWSLRLPALLHIAFGLAPCGVRAWSLWLSALLPAESGLGPSGCRRCSLRWSVLLQALALVLQGASGAATLGGRGARWSWWRCERRPSSYSPTTTLAKGGESARCSVKPWGFGDGCGCVG
jgi:hypothetical protein